LAEHRGLEADEALVGVAALEHLRDRVYRLEAALEDVDDDLGESATLEEYRGAFGHLYAAASDLRGAMVEPRARR
jgi:hypothetical protein